MHDIRQPSLPQLCPGFTEVLVSLTKLNWGVWLHQYICTGVFGFTNTFVLRCLASPIQIYWGFGFTNTFVLRCCGVWLHKYDCPTNKARHWPFSKAWAAIVLGIFIRDFNCGVTEGDHCLEVNPFCNGGRSTMDCINWKEFHMPSDTPVLTLR